jgi:hypothetical protein
MDRGRPLTEVDVGKLARDLLDALCYLEEFGLTHGDIKPDNIVLIKNDYKLIDFDLLPRLSDDSYLTQSYNDVYGCCLRAGILHPEYKTFRQAKYALCCTLMQFCKGRKPYATTTFEQTVFLEGMDFTVFVSDTAKYVNEDPKRWVEENFTEEFQTLALGLVGSNSFGSFREARRSITSDPIKTVILPSLAPLGTGWKFEPEATRGIYRMLKGDTETVAAAFNVFYRYGHLVETEEQKEEFLQACCWRALCNFDNEFVQHIVEVEGGLSITEEQGKNVRERVQAELERPGSWVTGKRETSLSFEIPLFEVEIVAPVGE